MKAVLNAEEKQDWNTALIKFLTLPPTKNVQWEETKKGSGKYIVTGKSKFNGTAGFTYESINTIA